MLMHDYILIKTGLNGMIARRDEEGASAVEYGLLVAGIAALIVAIVFLFGGMISDVFSSTCTKVATGASTGSDCTG
jgi:pilus assembly protein Flp/PilA